jgi:SAC3/GANP family
MDHLRSIMDRTDAPFSLIHNFLFDRYRSVRQDLYVQGIEVRTFSSLLVIGSLQDH